MTIQTVDTDQAVALPEVMPFINPDKFIEPQRKLKPVPTRKASQNGVYPEPPLWSSKKRASRKGAATQYQYEEEINYDEIITEDDEPVDSISCEKQQRLLIEPLYSSRYLPRPFIATANVGLFEHPKKPAIVPDILLSLGVSVGNDALDKANHSYFMWKYQKPPELVVEIVSNSKKENEIGTNFEQYAKLGVNYYVIVDIGNDEQDHVLHVYELQDAQYEPRDDFSLPNLGLSLTFWKGEFEDIEFTGIRWCDINGNLILTGRERAEQIRIETEQMRTEREQVRIRVEQAEVQIVKERLPAKQEPTEIELLNLEIERLRTKLYALSMSND
ncbi:MAG: Uma2 family endonuclease [Chloroflexota bacterium]